MVVEDFPNIFDWLFIDGALWTFFRILGFGAVAGLLIGFIVSSFRNGPGEAFYALSTTVFQSVPDLFLMSPRRVWAIATLAIKENRRLFVITLILFVVALGVGGWYMGGGSSRPEQAYIAFIFFAAQILATIFGVLVSAFSLPTDIQSKTVFTVVTKPVRASEIVVGRFLGFSLLGTVLLALIGGLSLVFMHRGLQHEHYFGNPDVAANESFTVDEWLPITDGLVEGRRPFHPFAVYEARSMTSLDSGHQHRVAIIQLPNEDGGEARYDVVVDEAAGHTHPVSILESDPETQLPTRLSFGSPSGNLKARRPIYAQPRGADRVALSFTDETGSPAQGGVNIGEMWDYQQYIQGGTEASAIFHFSDITESQFPDTDNIQLDLNVAVYRTHKGDIKKRVLAEIEIRNVIDKSQTQTAVQKSVRIPFETEEFKVQTLSIPRKITDGLITNADGTNQKAELDFFNDLAENGQVDVVLRCTDRQQYLGAARASVYFHAGDSSFNWNYAKGFIAMWFQLLIVIALTVALSTFLKGPVVMIGTFGVLVCGFSQQFIKMVTDSVLSGDLEKDIWGGGPLEALYRLITQMNLTQQLPNGIGFEIIQNVDRNVLLRTLDSITYAIPNLNKFNLAEYLANGYVIDNQLLGQNLIITVTFTVAMMVFGYFCFKTREIAAAS